jgi:acetyl esterase/lipase
MIPAFAQTDFLDPQFGVSVTSDIVYATGAVQSPVPGDKDLLLDLYEPTGAGVPPTKPGFVIIHGRGSDKADGKFVSWATDYAKRGYVCVSINYRVQEDDPPTPGDDQQERNVNAAVEDAANAIAWLKANAATLGVDPTRIAVGGNSAGAVTSLFVGFRELGPTAEVQAVVSYAGAMSNSTHEGHESEIDASDPPVILINSDEDHLAPYSRAVDVANAAAAAGIPYELHMLVGVSHPGVYNQRKTYILPDGDTPFEKIEAFVYTHLQLATIGEPLGELPLGGYGFWGLLILALSACALRRIHRSAH